MKNKLKTICITLGILTAALCLTSCWNSLSNDAGQSEQAEITSVLFKGKINPDSSLPKDLLNSKSDNSRAAGPASLDMTVFEYYVKATSSEGAVLTAEVTEDPATHQITFEMPLNFGVWTIETGIQNISTQEVILFDSFTTELLNSSPTFSHIFYLKPVTGGQGSIALEISVPATIEKMHIEVQNKPEGATFENEDIIPESNKININHTDLASGVYTVVLTFYDDKSAVYSSIQTINVLRGLQTTKWLSNGSSTLISNDGKFVISSAIIEVWRSQRTHYYIDYTSGDDFNSGAPLDPFKTLCKTIAIINDVYGTEAKEITISILNGSNENISDSIILNQNKKITIQSDDNSTTTLIRSHTGAFIEIPSSSELIISNFVFDGKEIEAFGNLGLKNEGILRMTACTIKDNKNAASSLGGGILNASDATLYLTDVMITGNFSDDYGAGLFNKGTATINTSTISGNESNSQGGGIFNEGSLTINNTSITGNSSGYGGGIANKKTLNLNSGEISANTASTQGAGIYLANNADAAINISGGLVKNNNLTGGTKSNLYLSSGKKIQISEAIKSGSEIWITFGWKPKKITTADNTIFTEGYGPSNNSGAPSSFFKSDVQYYIIPVSPSTGLMEAAIALSGKEFVNVFSSYKMTFSVHNNFNKFMPTDNEAANRTIQIDPKIMFNDTDVTEAAQNDINWNLALYYRGNLIGNEVASNTMVIPSEAAYTGRYDLHVSAEYLGLHKDAEFVISGYNNIININESNIQNIFEQFTNGTLNISRDTCINLTANNPEKIVDFSNTDFYPIGASIDNGRKCYKTKDFEGVFDGNGNTIKLNAQHLVATDFYAICYCNKGTIQNVIIECIGEVELLENYSGESDAATYGGDSRGQFRRYGGICSVNEGTIRNCWTKANVTGMFYGYIGGICGVNGGLIENCVNTGDFTNMTWGFDYSWNGQYGEAGGITGRNSVRGVIRNCVNYGKVELKTQANSSSCLNGTAGAICAVCTHGTSEVKNCYWLRNCVKTKSDLSVQNWVVFQPDSYNKESVTNGSFEGNGYFTSNTSTSLTAGPEVVGYIKTWPQTLQYGNNLLDALNAYVNAVDPNHAYLKEWEAGNGYAALLKQ